MTIKSEKETLGPNLKKLDKTVVSRDCTNTKVDTFSLWTKFYFQSVFACQRFETLTQ